MTEPMWSHVPAHHVDQILHATFGTQLSADGFRPARRRVWARARGPDIVDVFQIQALKGADLTPRWGFSLTFVPHVTSGRLRWHRTLRSAQLDVVDDPLDRALPEDVPSLLLNTSRGEAVLRAQANALYPFAIAQADSFWARVSAPPDLRSLFFELKARTNIRFDFYSYIAHPLAFAFTLSRLGESELAVKELERYVHFQDATTDLRRALLAALSAARSGREQFR